MKRIALSTLVAAAVLAVFYGGSVFVTMEVNPAKWSEFARFNLALIGGFTSFMVAYSFYLSRGDTK